MNIDYNLYKIFLYLYEEKSISKTASRLYVSQPAISYSLKELETQLGYPLFYRNSKGIEPTKEAHELYGYLSLAFQILDDALDHMNNLEHLTTGCVRIGTSTDLVNDYLVSFLSKFHKQYPNISFDIQTKSSQELMNLLKSRQLDFVIDYHFMSIDQSMEKKNVWNFTYQFVCLKELKEKKEDMTLLIPSFNSHHKKMKNQLPNSLTHQKPILEASCSMILKLVKEGYGIGLLPDYMISHEKGLEVLPLMEEPLKDCLSCVYVPAYLSKAADEMIRLLCEEEN